MYCRGELKPVSGILKRPPVEPELALPVIYFKYFWGEDIPTNFQIWSIFQNFDRKNAGTGFLGSPFLPTMAFPSQLQSEEFCENMFLKGLGDKRGGVCL